MKIIWSPEKEYELRWKRGIELSEIAVLLEDNKQYTIIDNPARKGQYLAVVPYSGYTCAVPFVLDEDGRTFIKTAYKSRKYHKRYGGGKQDEQ